MAYIELTDVDVDGCGTDVTVMMEIDSDGLTTGTVDRIQEAISNYKQENEGEWDSDGCFDAAAEQLEKEGYKVKYVLPIETICF